MGKIIVFMIVCTLSISVNTDCIDTYRWFSAGRYTDNGGIVTKSECKPWRDTGYVIFATAIPSGEDTDLEIAVLDDKNKKIVAILRRNGALSETAIRSYGISIDTANYSLNDNTMAFGIRTSWEGQSQPNPYGATTIGLYAMIGSGLTQVLDDTYVHKKVGEWDTVCNGTFTERDMILLMKKKSENEKYSRIAVKEKLMVSMLQKTPDGCIEFAGKPVFTTHLIKAKGEKYITPDSLRFE